MRRVTTFSLLWSVFAVALAVTFAPRPANAQYMYLDSNGDGVHTTADVITAVGTTTFDVWLKTDSNRDGSQPTCSAGSTPFTINSYGICLRTSGGNVSWTSAENLQPTMGIVFGKVGSATEYYIGYGGATSQPPGTYRLARLSLVVSSGAPTLQIVPRVAVNPVEETMFGSRCLGIDFDNTLKLGSDWLDNDGLGYSTGGSVNVPPTIPPIAAVTGGTGDITTRDIVANDSDGDLISITLSNSPSFLTATTLLNQTGQSRVRVHLSPLRHDVGDYTVDVAAADPGSSTQTSFAIHIQDGGDHAARVKSPLNGVDMLATTIRRIPVEAVDSDGDAIQLSLSNPRPFMTLEGGASSATARTAFLLLKPTLCDVGDWTASLQGATGPIAVASIPVRVKAGAPIPTNTVRVISPSAFLEGMVSSDFNGDGHADVAAILKGHPRYLSVFLGDGTGSFIAGTSVALPGINTELGAGDWNGDGKLDIVIGGSFTDGLLYLPGHGDGTFAPPVVVPDTPATNDFRTADLNEDGIDDLVATSESEAVYVLTQDGAGSLTVSFRVPTEVAAKNVAVGDFNLDGHLDLAMTLLQTSQVVSVMGRGDGTFGDPKVATLPDGSIALREGDFDRDGRLDLVTSLFDDGRVFYMKGDGAGGFTPYPVGTGPYITSDIAALDWNLDGNLDFVVAGGGSSPTVAFTGTGDGRFNPGATVFSGSAVAVAVSDFNEDARPDLMSTAGQLTEVLNATNATSGVASRAFLQSGGRSIPLNSSSSVVCAAIEPANGSFDVTTVDVPTIRLASEGTGVVQSIEASGAKSSIVGDSDKNGISDMAACFATRRLADLFSNLKGKRDVTAQLSGALLDGRRFCAPVTMTIIGNGTNSLAGRVEPNPLNPEGTLRFATKQPGAVSIRLFDVNGRLVRTVWNAHSTVVGDHEARIDGRDADGRALRSGVYFYRIEGGGADETGRFTVLK